MWGVIKTILGSGDVVSKGLELIDDMHTSKEEEIVAKNQARVNLLNAYAPFKVAQRFLALMFGATFILSFFLCLGMTLGGWGSVDDVFKILSAFYIGEIMGAIVLFYFGGGAFEGAFRAKNETKNGN